LRKQIESNRPIKHCSASRIHDCGCDLDRLDVDNPTYFSKLQLSEYGEVLAASSTLRKIQI